jgi:hypothetical protein
MKSKQDSGRFLKTSGSTANWYFEFQDGKMDRRTGEKTGFGPLRTNSGKSNVFCDAQGWNPAGQANPTNGHLIAR